MSKVLFVITFVVIGLIILATVLLTNDHIVNKNTFHLNNKGCFLQGNASVLFFNSDDNTVKYEIDEKTKENFKIEEKNGNISLYQNIRANIYVKLFDRNKDYPVIKVFLPKDMNQFDFKLSGNGDFIFKNPFTINHSVFKLDGNGDISSREKLTIQHCVIEIRKNGDVKFNKITGDTLQYKITDNGDMKISGEFLIQEKL